MKKVLALLVLAFLFGFIVPATLEEEPTNPPPVLVMENETHRFFKEYGTNLVIILDKETGEVVKTNKKIDEIF